MLIVIMGAHLTLEPTSIDLKENIIQKKFKKIIENKNVTTNIYRIEAYDSGPNKYEKKKDKMILKYFD